MSRSNGIPFIRKCWQPKKKSPMQWSRFAKGNFERGSGSDCMAGRGTQWMFFSKYLLFRQIFAGFKMSLEGKCCWAKNNWGCVRQLMSRIAGMFSLWETSFPPPPPPKGWISPLGHTHFPTTTPPTERLNFALWPHPNWPVMSGHTSADNLPSKSDCRL